MAKDTPDTPEPTIEEQLAMLLMELSDRIASMDKRLESIEDKQEEIVDEMSDMKEAVEFLAYSDYEGGGQD